MSELPLDSAFYQAVRFVQYREDTGEIWASGTMPHIFVANHVDGGDPYVIGEGQRDTHYVDLTTRKILERKPMEAVLNGVTVMGVPVPATLTWLHDSGSGGEIEVTESTIELDFDLPGSYRVTFEAVAFLPMVFEIEVPE